jgi:hypothetical protein
MSQHDYNIANQTFPATRTDLNNALGAIATNNAGNSAPSTTYANQWWFDSDGNQLYIRNKDNDSWVKVVTIGATSDKIDSIADSISIASTGGVTITTADNTDTLKLVSTDDDGNQGPILNFKRDSSSPADDDILGQLTFTGENSASEAIEFVRIRAGMADVTDGTEDSRYTITTFTGGSQFGRLNIEALETVFNENSTDIDFRVESNGNANMLFVNGGEDAVGIGTNVTNSRKLVIGTGGAKTATSTHYVMNIGQTTEASSHAGLGVYFVGGASAAVRKFQFQPVENGVANDGIIEFCPNGGKVGVKNSSPGRTFSVGGDGIIGLEGTSNALAFTESSSLKAYIASQSFGDHNGDGLGLVTSGNEPIKFYTNGSEEMRIEGDGTVFVGTTNVAVAANASGLLLGNDGYSAFRRDNGAVVYVNRFNGDGTLIKLHGDGVEEGSISVSGTTVTYGGFTGGHWSRLADNSKPTILSGTIMDSIDEMCDWYQAVVEVPEVLWTADDPETKNVLWTEDDILPEGVEVGDVKEEATKTVGDVKEEAHTVKESIALGDKSVGDAITFTSNGTEYTGTIFKEDDVKHTKCKVSDTVDSKKVYGVFSNWDDADDGLDGDVNDMNIAQVGTFVIRVNADEVVEAGDLLVSNGDGTAKVQDDDIIRSKTVAKVNSTVKIETYADGSYTVPCTLHC